MEVKFWPKQILKDLPKSSPGKPFQAILIAMIIFDHTEKYCDDSKK